MPDPDLTPPHPSAAARVAWTLLLAALVTVSWTGTLETTADRTISNTLERALLTAALARGLNGVISVAQGTEIAIQPVGVGVTITAGQILDPLNDLVERFSWLALAASASLGTQMLLAELLAETAVNALLTVAAVIATLVLWIPALNQRLRWLLRLAALVVFARFLFTVVVLTVGWVDHWVLQDRQEQALSGLSAATRDIEALERQPTGNSSGAGQSTLERFSHLLDSSRQALDVETRLMSLRQRVEASVAYLLDLIVLFMVQTLVLPLGAFYLAISAFRWFWQWSLASPALRRPMRSGKD